MSKNDFIYDKITNRIVELLDKGVVPWKQEWEGPTFPTNIATGKEYQGTNIFILYAEQLFNDYKYPYWAGIKQFNEIGTTVKPGESPTWIVFYKIVEKKNKETGEVEETYPMLRYAKVWNLAQVNNPEKLLPDNGRDNKELVECKAVVEGFEDCPEIVHRIGTPSYSRLTDKVSLPDINSFDKSESYYATLYHELAHSTGHPDRLDRHSAEGYEKPGSPREELAAEFAAAFLCGITGIAPKVEENTASYIDHWKGRLAEDKKLLFSSASAGRKAADYIAGKLAYI